MKQRELLVSPSDTCNNRCVFCLDRRHDELVSPQLGSLVDPDDEASFAQLLDAERPRAVRVVFTSGEPTMNKQLPELVKRVRSRGFERIMLVTNGRMLSYMNFCEALVEAGVTDFNISVHGPSEKTHQWHTRTKGSFRQTVRGLAHVSSLAHQYPITVKTTSVLTRFNYRSVVELLRFLSMFKITDATLIPFIPEGNVLAHFERIFVGYREIGMEISRTLDELGSLRFSVYVLHLPRCVLRNGAVTTSGEGHLVGEEGKEILRPPKGKRKDCARCRYNAVCEGVWKAYTDRMGWDEFNPVPPERDSASAAVSGQG